MENIMEEWLLNDEKETKFLKHRHNTSIVLEPQIPKDLKHIFANCAITGVFAALWESDFKRSGEKAETASDRLL